MGRKSAAVPRRPQSSTWLTIGLYSADSCKFLQRIKVSNILRNSSARDADRLDGGSRDSWRPGVKEARTDWIIVTVFDDQAA